MPRVLSVTATLALCAAAYLLFPACGNDCAGETCDTTRVVVTIVDADDEEAVASRVTYTLAPYDEDGVEVTDPDEADELGYDLEEVRKALCTNEDEDGNCSTWVAESGFGHYYFTAEYVDEDGVSTTATGDVELEQPAKAKKCCGKVASGDLSMTIDPEGTSGGDDSGDSGT